MVDYELTPGRYRLEIDRALHRTVRAGSTPWAATFAWTRFTCRRYENPAVREAHFAASDEHLNRLFAAGRETFAQNAVDLFMDCPSRERAGWLCDSFFTARTALDLSGDCAVETCFLENYVLPERFAHLPEGMLPMCYPADHPDEVFIPNWALWLVIQLEEYLARSGNRVLVDAFEPRVRALFDYFAPFENELGLLEKLESWVFIEWSAANRFTRDVNFPSNMLYAGALDAAGRLFGDAGLRERAGKLRETIRRVAFDGTFFVDNALRKEGKLMVTENRTEVCQYFAFFFDTATPESHPELFRKLVEEFGPKRQAAGLYPEVHPANAFVGNLVRFEILSRYDHGGRILDESADYLLYMADTTGTLWRERPRSRQPEPRFRVPHRAHPIPRRTGPEIRGPGEPRDPPPNPGPGSRLVRGHPTRSPRTDHAVLAPREGKAHLPPRPPRRLSGGKNSDRHHFSFLEKWCLSLFFGGNR